VLSSCVERVSRTAPAAAQPRAAGQPGPAPRSDWRPGGPPAAPAPDEAAAEAPEQPLPSPGEPLGFAAHIKPLFRDCDRQSMSFAFDLWSCDDIRARAADILDRLQNGSMPCDGAWPPAKVKVFRRWIDTGMYP
jgi:hypothetical protein